MLLTFAIYFFCVDPERAQRARTEVLDNFGHDDDPSFDSLQGLPYGQYSDILHLETSLNILQSEHGSTRPFVFFLLFPSFVLGAFALLFFRSLFSESGESSWGLRFA